jgi:hypothetical protein
MVEQFPHHELPSDTRSPIFIGGQPRSGTTLVRVLLNRHSNIACGPESKFAQHPSFVSWHDQFAAQWSEQFARYGLGSQEVDRAVAALVDNLFTRYQVREGKQRWAEKTPTNILRIDYLFRLFPHAQFIHIIRDPRDTYCSIRERARKGKHKWDKKTPRRSAQEWRDTILAGMPWRAVPERYQEVRYEHLARSPEPVLRDLMRFLGEPWDPRMLDPEADNAEVRSARARLQRGPVFTTSIGRWHTDLKPDEIADIEDVAGDLMVDLGYTLHTGSGAP